MKRIYLMIESCQDCGELLDDCYCDLIELVEEDNKDFKFEYAFESLSENNSQFRKVYPKYE
jgi:hypothetical protein